VIFVGTALSYAVAVIFHKLGKIISKNLNLLGYLKTIFRPYPHRQGNDTIIADSLKNVKIDPQVFKACKR